MHSCAPPSAARIRRLLLCGLGAATVAGTLLGPGVTGLHRARADAVALPQAAFGTAAALVAPGGGGLDLFYASPNGSLVHAHSAGGTATWGSAENLGGVAVGGAAAAADDGSLAVTVRGTDSQLYLNRRGSGSWSGWVALGGILTAKPALASSSGQLDVFVRGASGSVYTRSEIGGRWTAWVNLGGVLAPGTGPAATSLRDGRTSVLVKGITGALYVKTRAAGGTWSGWSSLGGLLASEPAAASAGPGQLSVFVRGTTSHLYQRSYARAAWSNWADVGGILTGAPAAAASPGTGRTDVVVPGTDGRLYQRTHTGAWSAWVGITPPSVLKPALGGLMTRGVPSPAEVPYLGAFAVVLDWREVEPARGRYDFSFIEARTATARKYGMGVRLRVNAGTQAPDWAKAIGGPPVTTYDHQRNVTTTIGRFWTPAYQAAWRELQSTLAARYDANPTVREVNVSGTGVLSSEVMLLMATDTVPSTGRTNGSYWLAAGYTEAQRQAALAGDIEFMSAVWRRTRLDLTMHPMQMLDASGRVTSSVPTSIALWDRARARNRGLHAFHTGFGMPIITGAKKEPRAVYDALLARRVPFDVQTLNLDAGLGDPNVVLPWAASHGMLSLELPGGKGWEAWSKTLLSTTNARLKANAAAVR